MTLDAVLLEHLRLGSRELWRGWRARVGVRLCFSVLFVHLAFYGMLWLMGEAWLAGRHRDVGVGVARILLPVAGVCVGCGTALLGSLNGLIVSGPLLRSLGDLVLGARLQPDAPDLAGQFAAFTSRGGLARLARIRDLPLIVFLTRTILGVNVKPLLQAARGGLDSEGLVRELERQARSRAARTFRRLGILLYILVGFAVLFPFIIGALFG
jgi:hypothetical protein